MLHTAAVKQEWVRQHDIAGHARHFVEMAERFREDFCEQVEVRDTVRVAGQDARGLFVRSASEDCATAAWCRVGEQADDQQALEGAVDAMAEPITVDMPACRDDVVRPVGAKAKVDGPQPPFASAAPADR